MIVFKPGIAFITDAKTVIAIHYGCAWTAEQFVEAKELGEPIVRPE